MPTPNSIFLYKAGQDESPSLRIPKTGTDVVLDKLVRRNSHAGNYLRPSIFDCAARNAFANPRGAVGARWQQTNAL